MKLKRVQYREPLREGEIPKSYTVKDGMLYEIILEESDYKDINKGRVLGTDTWYLSDDKEEYYGFETICKACGTRWMAIKDGYEYDVRNYCPGCGRALTDQKEKEKEKEINDARYNIGWVIEYLETVGESHKQAYIEGLKMVDRLLGKLKG